jgi:uncharacterized coiled-coil DUF342 family protein
MGLGGTAKKLQKVIDVADELYKRVNELREELNDVRNRIDETNGRVKSVQGELAEQRELLERIAEANDVELEMTTAPETDGDNPGSE